MTEKKEYSASVAGYGSGVKGFYVIAYCREFGNRSVIFYSGAWQDGLHTFPPGKRQEVMVTVFETPEGKLQADSARVSRPEDRPPDDVSNDDGKPN